MSDSQALPAQFRIKRTYLQPTAGEATMRSDRKAHCVSADSAKAAAVIFINEDHARLLGSVSELPTGEVTATAWREGRVYVISVGRWDGEDGAP